MALTRAEEASMPDRIVEIALRGATGSPRGGVRDAGVSLIDVAREA